MCTNTLYAYISTVCLFVGYINNLRYSNTLIIIIVISAQALLRQHLLCHEHRCVHFNSLADILNVIIGEENVTTYYVCVTTDRVNG